MTDKNGIIVLGGHIQALGIVRILGRLGIPSVVITGITFSLARHSRYCRHYYSIPDSEIEPFLFDLGRNGRYLNWTIFPTNDFHVRLLSENKAELEKYFYVTADNWNTTGRFYDKCATYRLAIECGISIPETHFPGSESDLDNLRLQYPAIIKPAVMHIFFARFRKKVFVCNNHDELVAGYRRAVSAIDPSQVIIQHIIPGSVGSQFSAGILALNGKIILSLVACRVRQHPLNFGNATTYAEIVDEPQLLEYSERLIRETGFTGLCEVEFKRDSDDGRFKLLEVNPRTWKWHSIANAAGVPMLESFYNHLNRLPLPSVAKEVKKASFWHFVTDFPVLISLLFSGQKPSLRIKRPVENAVWAKDDIAPWIYEKLYLPILIIKRG